MAATDSEIAIPYGLVPETMLAAEVHEFNKPYTIHQIPTPKTLPAHFLLLKTAVASFCHTDALILEGGLAPKPPHFPGGHEPTGTVVLAGSAVKDFKKGDRVAALGFANTCGVCSDCTAEGADSLEMYCQSDKQTFTSMSAPGTFAEYVTVDARSAVHVPEKLSFISAGPLTCAGATAFRAIKRSGAKAGDRLGMVGSGGGLGHLAIQFAKAMDITVVGLDARDVGLDLTQRAGADFVFDIRKGLAAIVEELEGNGGLCKSTIAFSDHPTASATSCAITEVHGLVVQVAQPVDGVVVPFQEFVFRDIRMIGSKLSSRDELKELVDLVAEKGIKVETKVYDGLKQLPEVLEETRRGGVAGKLVMIVDQEQVAEDKKRGSTL